MKLHAPIYNSPIPTQGTFNNVYIEDVCITNRRLEKKLVLDFDVYYIKDDKKIILGKIIKMFKGMNGDEDSTNRTMYMKYPNPDLLPQTITVPNPDYVDIPQTITIPNPDYIEGGEELETIEVPNPDYTGDVATTIVIPNPDYIEVPEWIEDVPFIAYMQEHLGVPPTGFVITDFGCPDYQDVIGYFEGGTLDSPEIIINNPLAMGFILSELRFNGQPLGVQFQFVQ